MRKILRQRARLNEIHGSRESGLMRCERAVTILQMHDLRDIHFHSGSSALRENSLVSSRSIRKIVLPILILVRGHTILD